MNSSPTFVHNGAFRRAELIELFNVVGFNRLNEWRLENIDDIFAHTDHYVVAKADNRLVGFVRLLTDWHTRGYLSNLCVAPTHQRKGIGTALMREILRVCDEHRILVLNVYDTSAHPDFYKGLGFESDQSAIGLHRICPGFKKATP